MRGLLCFALFCLLFIGSEGWTIIPSGIPGGYSTVKPWIPVIQWAARYAVAAMGPWNRLITVLHAQQAVSKLKLINMLHIKKYIYIIKMIVEFSFHCALNVTTEGTLYDGMNFLAIWTTLTSGTRS